MKGNKYFLLAILFLAIVTIFLSVQIGSSSARLLPLIISLALAALAAGSLFAERKKKAAKETEAIPGEVRISLITAVWLVGFLLLIVLIGFPLAIFLFVTAYLKLHNRGWFKSLVLGLGLTVFVYVGFDYLLEVNLFRGVLYIPFYRLLP